MNSELASFLIGLLEIIWIDVILSGDNAVVIALACRALPENQRMRGIILGSGAAIGLRIVLTFVFVGALTLPYVKLIGGLLLLAIAFKLALEGEGTEEVAASPSLCAAVRTIVVADALMSLDNVVAVTAAAKGSLVLVAIGTLLAVPLIIFGSTLLTRVFARYPLLIWAGAGLLGFIAGELAAGEPVVARLVETGPSGFVTRNFALLCGLAGALLVVSIAFVFRPRAKAKFKS